MTEIPSSLSHLERLIYVPVQDFCQKEFYTDNCRLYSKAPISTKQILVVTLKHPFYLNSPHRAHPFSHSLSQLIVTVSHVQPTPFPPSIANPLFCMHSPPALLSKNLPFSSFQRLFSNCHLEFSAPCRKIVKFMGACLLQREAAQSVVGLSSAAPAVMRP